MCTDLSLFPESLARTLLWFISGFLERDLIDGHMALHNTNLYGTLVRSYSLGCLILNFAFYFQFFIYRPMSLEINILCTLYSHLKYFSVDLIEVYGCFFFIFVVFSPKTLTPMRFPKQYLISFRFHTAS